jgi:hypothetical protein
MNKYKYTLFWCWFPNGRSVLLNDILDIGCAVSEFESILINCKGHFKVVE